MPFAVPGGAGGSPCAPSKERGTRPWMGQRGDNSWEISTGRSTCSSSSTEDDSYTAEAVEASSEEQAELEVLARNEDVESVELARVYHVGREDPEDR